MLDQITSRFLDNLARVENLLQLYEASHGHGRGRRSVSANDLLRATTVFLHATLEDFLRSVAHWRLPTASPESLEDIPLAGISGRAQKFTLAAVARHRGKTVDQLIRDSVSAYLERSNYNNTQEISTLLSSIGVDPSRINGRFGQLDALMTRRHLIVHQADRSPQVSRGRHRARHITVHDVRTWITAVRDFVTAAEHELRALP